MVFKSNRKPIDPLQPNYNFSKIQELPIEEPRFIRDSMKISDIAGTSPRFFHDKTLHETNKVNDIIGASPGRVKYLNKNYDTLNYRDVSHYIFQSKRVGNPLTPIYSLKFGDGETIQVGPIERNKPEPYNPFVNKPVKNLITDDIDGCRVGSKNKYSFYNGSNLSLATGDIKGATAGTKTRGLVTKRVTNPLEPHYLVPGFSEPHLRTMNNPYDNYKLIVKEEPKRAVRQETEKVEKKEEIKIEERVEKKEVSQVLEKIEFAYDRPAPYYGILKDKFIIPTFEKHKLAEKEMSKSVKVPKK